MNGRSSIVPQIFIIILNWNGLNDTIECVESVLKSTYSNFEIVVVDNGSVENPVNEIKKYKKIHFIINGTNLGFTGGNNIAIRYAMEQGGDLFWLINNDTVVEPDTLAKIAQLAGNHPDTGLISPVIKFYHQPEKIQFAGGYLNINEQKMRHSQILANNDKKIYDYCNLLWGTALLIKREIVEKVGYLDDRFFAYWEDIDYSLRTIRKGYKCAVAYDCCIYHKDSGSSKNKKYLWYFFITRNSFLMWTKHLSGVRKLKFIIQKFIPSVFRRVHRLREENMMREAEATLSGVWNAFIGKYGSWENRSPTPKYLDSFISWHPIFIANLFEGNFKSILKTIMKTNLS